MRKGPAGCQWAGLSRCHSLTSGLETHLEVSNQSLCVCTCVYVCCVGEEQALCCMKMSV